MDFTYISANSWTARWYKTDQEKTQSLSGWDCYSLQIDPFGEGSDMARETRPDASGSLHLTIVPGIERKAIFRLFTIPWPQRKGIGGGAVLRDRLEVTQII